MTKEEELQNSLSKTIDYYENYISKLNHQNVMVYATARNYEDKCKLLQDQLALTEKALELMYEEYKKDSTPANWIYHISKDEYIEHIKTKAKEMMKSE